MSELERNKLITDAFAMARRDHEELEQVRLHVSESDELSGGTLILPKTDSEGRVLLEFRNATRDDVQELMRHRTESIEMVAELLEIEPGQVTVNLLKVFILLQEAGHAYDYIKNYLEKEIRDGSDTPKATATLEFNDNLRTEMCSLPVPNMTPTELEWDLDAVTHGGRLDSIDALLSVESHIMQMAKDDPDQLLVLQTKAYQALESDKVARIFAVAVMQRNNLIETLKKK